MIVLGLALAMGICWTTSVLAATYTVDDDGPASFNAIQPAINFAGIGDTILVKAGSYVEDIVLKTGVKVMGGRICCHFPQWNRHRECGLRK